MSWLIGGMCKRCESLSRAVLTVEGLIVVRSAKLQLYERVVRFPGDLCDEATPVPIPNTVVKLASSDNTAGATQWEDSPLPGNLTARP